MSQCGNNNDLALQHGGFWTTWSLAAKGLLGTSRCNDAMCHKFALRSLSTGRFFSHRRRAQVNFESESYKMSMTSGNCQQNPVFTVRVKKREKIRDRLLFMSTVGWRDPSESKTKRFDPLQWEWKKLWPFRNTLETDSSPLQKKKEREAYSFNQYLFTYPSKNL